MGKLELFFFLRPWNKERKNKKYNFYVGLIADRATIELRKAEVMGVCVGERSAVMLLVLLLLLINYVH